MPSDYVQFFQAINPSKTLVYADESDRRYYIDFSSVRGGEIIKKLKNRIVTLSPDNPTCSLFTGHIGCGKSTELRRLQKELEDEEFHVVYFESSEDLEMADVDIIDVLLVIAKRISQSLDKLSIAEPKGLKNMLQKVSELLMTEVEVAASGNIPGVGKVAVDTEKGKLEVETAMGKASASSKDGFSLAALGIGEITVKAKNDARLREKLNQYLGPRKTELLRLINTELIEPGIAQLKQQNLKGLVVIVDNLDRIHNSVKSFGKPQQEYLFVDQGEILTKLNCHMIYTIPLALKFSNEYSNLRQRFNNAPQFLPMVSIKLRDGTPCQEGIDLLKQMVLARKFPSLSTEERLKHCSEIFDEEASFERLCQISGGHVRDLLQLLTSWVEEEMELPLTLDTLEDVIAERCNEMSLAISEEEWDLLRQVQQTKNVSDEQGYQKLIHSRMVFEYREKRKSWFDVNPILAEAEELKS